MARSPLASGATASVSKTRSTTRSQCCCAARQPLSSLPWIFTNATAKSGGIWYLLPPKHRVSRRGMSSGTVDLGEELVDRLPAPGSDGGVDHGAGHRAGHGGPDQPARDGQEPGEDRT